MNYIKAKNYEDLSIKAANMIAAQIIQKPDSVIGLATGSTPVGTYSKLAEYCKEGHIDFSKVITVNLDEYAGMEPTNEQSYRYFMNKNLFDKVNICKENTFVPNGCAQDLAAEGKAYDERIQKFGGIDLQLLGIGVDGHIGFNEPDEIFTAATHPVVLDPSTIEANARFFENADQVPKMAITMGMMSIMQAKKIVMVVNGLAKKEILEKSIYGPITPEVPASILQLHPNVTVIYSEI